MPPLLVCCNVSAVTLTPLVVRCDGADLLVPPLVVPARLARPSPLAWMIAARTFPGLLSFAFVTVSAERS
jgi:hypothetical protein